jgi:hypothetical protein
MAWFKGCYYKSIRTGKCVTSRYFGSGPDAQLVAAWDAADRRERAERRAEALARSEAQRLAYKAERDRGEKVRALVTAGLRALGYWRPQRLRWRRRRMKALTGPEPTPCHKPTRREARDLMRRVANDVKGALDEWRELVRVYPDVAIDAACSDLYELAVYSLGKHEFPKRETTRDALAVLLRQLQAELVGTETAPALRLTAQCVVFAWADHWVLSAVSAHHGVQRDDAMMVRRRTAACKRLLSAIKCHEQIRALHGRPVLNVIH